MDIYQLVLIVLYNMAVFAVGQLPIIMLFFLKKSFSLDSYGKQTIVRMLPAAVFLMIIPVYNVVSVLMEQSSENIVYNNNISLLFAIGIVLVILLNIFTIIERIVTRTNIKNRKIAIYITLVIVILLAVVSLYNMIVVSQKSGMNYLDYVVNIVYPIMISTMSIISVVGLFFLKQLGRMNRHTLIVFLSFIPLVIIDILLLKNVFVQLISLPFGVYIIMIFIDALLSAKKQAKESKSFIETVKGYELTVREAEVLELVAQGLSNKVISEKLFVSVNTIKSHMQRIYKKVNVSNRYQLISIMKNINEET